MSTPSERSMHARVASLTRWSREANPAAALEPARKGFDARFERELDEMGVTDPVDRARRKKQLRKAYMANLARKSAITRRKAVEARKAPAA